MSRLQVPIVYLGAYQFKMAPAELAFSYIKTHDLNTANVKVNTK
jgi:hypothetical protein